MSVELSGRDAADVRFAAAASGLLREFNAAGVVDAADVHVARRLGALAGEGDEAVLLACALAVRAPRLGHVHVDLAHIRQTAAVDAEEPVDLASLAWPEPGDWVRRVRRSPLVGLGDGTGGDVRPLRCAGSWLYLDRYWSEEEFVARALRELADAPAGAPDQELLDDGLRRLFGDSASGAGGAAGASASGAAGASGGSEVDDNPARAAATAVHRRLAVIAGGPGTGKTTTVARVVALLCEQALAAGQPMPLIALAAPTGKAAARLQEAVHEEAATLDVPEPVRETLRGLRAQTIHRLLGWRPGTNSRFRHDRTQRLPHDLLVVDETSMVSLSLMARLIEALRSTARLVLVGDPGQLASIEAGAVLGDIVGPPAPPALTSGIVVLERVHRFGGAIARVAAAIRAGDADLTVRLLAQGEEEVTWVRADVGEVDAPPQVAAPALAAARAVIAHARAGDAAQALTALGAFRVLCAHRRGSYGVAGWTTRLEGWLAQDIAGRGSDDRWYVGRPLLVTENDYELRLSNGDTGVVVQGDGDRALAAFARGDEVAQISPSRLGAVQTVYAMTIHKSQGSQFQTAAVLLPAPDSRILTRELLYTAVTRAQRHLIVAGTEESVRAAVERPVARASGLGARLRGELED